MPTKNSFTYTLTPAQQQELLNILQTGNYRTISREYTIIAVEGDDYNIALYKSGKCLIQGKGAQEWVTFYLEPFVLKEAKIGYEDVIAPPVSPHLGIDESGKGDFFGPLVIAAVYTDAELTKAFRQINVRDSKTISSAKQVDDLALEIKKLVGNRFSIVAIGPEAYNRLYASFRNLNRLLAWGHARAIENALEKVPDCPAALSDKFGPTHQIEQALLKKGQSIKLEQKTHAESDMAVAAASILARSAFVAALRRLSEQYGVEMAKGVSPQVKKGAQTLITKHGPEVLLKIAKCHFKTTDDVLELCGMKREILGPQGAVVSKAVSFFQRRKQS